MPSVSADPIAPAFHWMPEYDRTFGPEVADVCDLAGFPPDAEQRLWLDMVFAVDRRGRSATRDAAMAVPRQNMKTGALKQCALGWLYVLELRLIVWSAHEFSTAQEAFRDMCDLIESCPDLAAEVKQIHRGNGDEAIELKGDRRLKFRARTKSGGRGLTGDRVVLDEAMLLKASMLGSLIPTLRAVPDPQVVFAGSAGGLEADIWRTIRDRGRAGGDPSLAWLEYADPDAWACADPDCSHIFGRAVGCAMDDESRWWRSNPALGRRIDLESLRSDRRLLPPAEFARETLGWWEDPPTDEDPDNPLTNWTNLAEPDANPEGSVVLAVDAAPDMVWASIVAYGSGPKGEVVERVAHARGAAWVPERLAELRERHDVRAWGLVDGSPAASLLPDLPGDGVLLNGPQYAAACQGFASAVTDREFAHRADPELDESMKAATRRFSGDGWRWSRRDAESDISLTVAATVAHYLWQTAPEPYDPLDNI